MTSKRKPPGAMTDRDLRRVLDDFAEAERTGRTPEEIQRERHERERAEVLARTARPLRWWIRLLRWHA